jgi:hypothetical protein
MAKTRKRLPNASEAVTAKRAARLCKLLALLGKGPQTRSALMRRLKLDVRGFYRDLVQLRKYGIGVVLEKRRYRLEEKAEAAIARLPFPDPQLTLGEAMQLARGRTTAHRKLKEQIAAIVP